MMMPSKVERREPSAPGVQAFTMIEIALCLAIIGFALVAIIGVLPTGMGVQKDNREETIVDQDAAVWMDAIRNGARAYDDLTNYVVAITNYWTSYEVVEGHTNRLRTDFDWYTPTRSHVTSQAVPDDAYALTNGFRIIGLLSTPKYDPRPPMLFDNLTFRSNYFVAIVRAMSGTAVEKPPQTDSVRADMAFTYRMIIENVPYVPAAPLVATNFTTLSGNLWTNSHDVRLTFRYPVLPTTTGNGRLTFRMLTGGRLVRTNDLKRQAVYFFDPTTYVQAK